MKPRIGITSSFDNAKSRRAVLDFDYARSVAQSGGLPFVLPSFAMPVDPRDILDGIDGLLLSGGGDVSPLRYGEEPLRGLGSVSVERDEFEMALAIEARRRGMPIFGICRGHQLLDVAFGGTLYQDIGAQLSGAIEHDPPEDQAVDEFWHGIEVLPTSRRLGLPEGETKILVNSFHHQGVKTLAPGLIATAISVDGLVEAFEAEDGGWLLGVQFHPEALTVRHRRFEAMFTAHVRAAAAWSTGD